MEGSVVSPSRWTVPLNTNRARSAPFERTRAIRTSERAPGSGAGGCRPRILLQFLQANAVRLWRLDTIPSTQLVPNPKLYFDGVCDRSEPPHQRLLTARRARPPAAAAAGTSEPYAAGDPELVVGGVVHVRVVGDAHEPSSPVDIRAGRPGSHNQPFVAGAALANHVERQAPSVRQVAAEVQVRVGLSRSKPVVVDGKRRDDRAGLVAIASAELHVVVGIEAEIPVRIQVRPPGAGDGV